MDLFFGHRLIRSYGSDSSWTEEVPSLIKRDMASLTDKGSGSASSLNLQQVLCPYVGVAG